tara:strand:+ start:173 stop:547 length:375 start_codon:yes stop_codon:yes gene_type:complete
MGKELRIPMWDGLTEQQKKTVMIDDRDAAVLDYYVCKHNERSNTLNILPFDPYEMYDVEDQCVYSLDLNTLKPTDTSYNRTSLSDVLCQQIQRLYPPMKWMQIDSSMTQQDIITYLRDGYSLYK